MKKNLIAGLSRIVDSMVTDSNKRLDEYILGSLRKNGLESLANVEEHEDGIRVSLQGYPFAYVDIYLDGEKVVADYSRNAQEIYPGTVKKYAQFAGIPEEQAKTEVEKFYKWMHVMKEHTGGLVDDIQKLKVSDSEEVVDSFVIKGKVNGKYFIESLNGESQWGDLSKAMRFDSESSAEYQANHNRVKEYIVEKVEDCGVTTSTDVDAGIPGNTKPVDDSEEVVDSFVIKGKVNGKYFIESLNGESQWGDLSKAMRFDSESSAEYQANHNRVKEYIVEKVEDCGVTTSTDVDAGIPGNTKPVDDSRQDEVISYSWDEFEQKLDEYKELKDHSVVIGDKTYILSGTVVEDKVEGKVGDSQEYRIEDDREYSKQQLIDRPPLWIKDKDIWEKAVDNATRGGSKDTTVVVPIVIYKRMGGTKAMNKKEKEERAAADERRMQAETSREGVEDSMFDKIKVGDTLRIVRGDHVGRFAEVLEVKEDGSYRLKDLQTEEEFDEPSNLFGVRVTVTDSGYSDAEDEVSLRSALATILKETDPKVRQRSIQSKVLSFLNAYGMDAEIESDGKIWLNDDDTSVQVDGSTVSIKKGGETDTEDYALLEDIEKWYGRIKELSGK